MTPQEVRSRILEVVARNGGHLASSLGAVEIAMALCETFDPETDRIVWDIGHQAYAWKLLTDRKGKPFDALRRLDGIAPFPTPAESAADAAVSGHAGVALSVASGLAAARDRRGSGENVIAVVGDAALANGTSLEALGNLAAATSRLIVVLNDNGTGDRGGSTVFDSAFFERFGLRYVGPVDGHDLVRLKDAFAVAREHGRSVIVHVVTTKGKGYPPAEGDPMGFHGVGPGCLASGAGSDTARLPAPDTWSARFGDALRRAAREDDRIVALTAGMREGTGLADFAREFPTRFHDVGIAEGHMVAFAAGLAAGGLRPVVAVYSTFLQRAIDQVMHDVCIANLPVVFCVDRAGVVGEDGATHQGVFDIAMLRALPNLTICQPKDADDLEALLREALRRNGPTVIRYPRGVAPRGVEKLRGCEVERARVCPGSQPPNCSTSRPRIAIWAAGDQLEKARAVSARLPGAEVVFARYLKPFDAELLKRQRAAGMRIVSLENGAVAGGFGEAIGADPRFGWPDEFIPHGPVAELEKRYGLDVDSIVEAIRRAFPDGTGK